MRVFLDTNVWLAAVVFPGLCAELVIELDTRGHRLLSSRLVRNELRGVLERKFRRHAAAIDRFDSLWACAEEVPDAAEPAHDADARLVAAARSAGAELFVTGDQRVLGWDTGAGMRLLSPRQAWKWVARAAP